MGIIDFFINLLKDPRGFIAGWIIALGPVWVYTPLFLIVFVETGLVFFRALRAKVPRIGMGARQRSLMAASSRT